MGLCSRGLSLLLVEFLCLRFRGLIFKRAYYFFGGGGWGGGLLSEFYGITCNKDYCDLLKDLLAQAIAFSRLLRFVLCLMSC